MILVSSCICLCPIYLSQVLSREWRCSWSSAYRRCSNYIWVINNLITYWGASYIRDLTVCLIFMKISNILITFFGPSVYELHNYHSSPKRFHWWLNIRYQFTAILHWQSKDYQDWIWNSIDFHWKVKYKSIYHIKLMILYSIMHWMGTISFGDWDNPWPVYKQDMACRIWQSLQTIMIIIVVNDGINHYTNYE